MLAVLFREVGGVSSRRVHPSMPTLPEVHRRESLHAGSIPVGSTLPFVAFPGH